MVEKVKNISISDLSSMLDALKKMDNVKRKLLFVISNNVFLGLLSIGDIQRAIINGIPLSSSINCVLRKNILTCFIGETLDEIKSKMLIHRTECMPILGESHELVDVVFWDDVFKETAIEVEPIALGLPVVIMAGGKGTRLLPLTNVIPKPMIPIGDKTIIEEIMEKFAKVGCDQFYISVNHKFELLQYYLENNNNNNKLEFFKENKPLGTAGSLFLLKTKITSTFFISNCDILVDINYKDLYNFHKEGGFELTIVSALKHVYIPYGTIETEALGHLKGFIEKPELTFQVNTGLYVVEPHILYEIPENEFFPINILVENILNRKGKVGVFPVSEGAWTDIGDWEGYLKIISQRQITV